MRLRHDAMGYAVSPAIPNRPIALEVDRGRQREMLRWLLAIAVLVAAALFNAGQRQGIVSKGFQLEKVQSQRAAEEMNARYLSLEIQTLLAPARIEKVARERLQLVRPGQGDAVVIERVVPPEQPPSSVVASR